MDCTTYTQGFLDFIVVLCVVGGMGLGILCCRPWAYRS